MSIANSSSFALRILRGERYVRSSVLKFTTVVKKGNNHIESGSHNEVENKEKEVNTSLKNASDSGNDNDELHPHWSQLESRILRRKPIPLSANKPQGRNNLRSTPWDAENV